MKTIHIYGLTDPRDSSGFVFYIGQTNDTKMRLHQHINCPGSNALRNWSVILRKAVVRPKMIILEITDEEQANAREAFWLEHYKSNGQAIFNGIHTPAPVVDPEADALTLDQAKLRHVRAVLRLTKGNQAKAARLLRISRMTVRQIVRKNAMVPDLVPTDASIWNASLDALVQSRPSS